jgi:uncharacterized protein DUF5677
MCVAVTHRARFTDGMPSDAEVAAARDQIEAAVPNAFAFEQLATRSIRGLAARCAGRTWIGMSEPTAMRALDSIMAEADRTWVARHLCEQAIGVINEDEFRVLDAAIMLARACLKLLERRPDASVPGDVAYIVAEMGVRAQATCHEVSALLRAGFPNGARARWRTLYEVAVVSSVLMLGNRYTASRYKNHRWIMLARDREHHDEHIRWPGGPSPEAMQRRLIRRYGDEYRGTYGWASLVTRRLLGVTRPKWYHLEGVARLADGHRHRVKHAHHSVHVDSLGVLELLDSSGVFHAGAQIEGVRPIVWQTLRALAEAIDSLIAIWQRYDPSPLVVANRVYADRILLELETEVAGRF